MKWPGPIVTGTLQRRYKRFLADIVLDSGESITAHCPNTGAMTGCDVPGSRVWLTRSDSPKRKYPYTWQCVEVGGAQICIHSALANTLVAEAIEAGSIRQLHRYSRYRREHKLDTGSRIDFLLHGDGCPDCYMEVKAVTLHSGNGVGAFPDAVSLRARRHLDELIALRREGYAAVLFFAVLHSDIAHVQAAWQVDPAYGEHLLVARDAGVEVVAYRAQLDLSGIALRESLPVVLGRDQSAPSA